MSATYTNDGAKFVSECAFGAPLTIDDETTLARAYRKAGIKRFHAMNAGVLDLEQTCVFYSYYTELARLFYSVRSEHYTLVVAPFVYDTVTYANSRTSNRQLDRWLYESGIETGVKRIRSFYERACKSDIGNRSETFPVIYGYNPHHRDSDGVPVLLRFANQQHTLNYDGTIDVELVNERVPALVYNSSEAHMYKVGVFVHRGNEFGLAHAR